MLIVRIVACLVVFFEAGSAVVVKLDCHPKVETNDQDAFIQATLQVGNVYKVLLPPSDSENPHGACTWRLSSLTRSLAVIEFHQKDSPENQPVVVPAEAIRDLKIAVIRKSTEIFNFLWSSIKSLFVPVDNGDVIKIDFYIGRSRNTRFGDSFQLHVSVVTDDFCPSGDGFHKYGQTCFALRPAHFICDDNQDLSSCAMLSKFSVRFEKPIEIAEFARNLFSQKAFRQLLAQSKVIIGLQYQGSIWDVCAELNTHDIKCQSKKIDKTIEINSREPKVTICTQFFALRLAYISDRVPFESSTHAAKQLVLLASPKENVLIPTSTSSTKTKTEATSCDFNKSEKHSIKSVAIIAALFVLASVEYCKNQY